MTTFPQAEIFGVKLVNNHPTQALVEFSNNEPEPITLAVIGAYLSTLDVLPEGVPASASIIRNFTSTRYNVEIPAGEKLSFPYSFATELHPQDLRLQIAAVVHNAAGDLFQIQALNETVSIVEAPTSFFDPQMYV